MTTGALLWLAVIGMLVGIAGGLCQSLRDREWAWPSILTLSSVIVFTLSAALS